MNKKRIAFGFNILAPFYNFFLFLFFGNKIRTVQKHYLSHIKNESSILIFGGGTGAILKDCLVFNKNAAYTYVDISSKMIELAKKRVSKKDIKIDYLIGSYDVIPATKFAVIITPFVLDCFVEKELLIVIKQLKKHLKKDGKWLFSDFNFDAPKKTHQLIIKFLYFSFNALCNLKTTQLPDFKNCFNKNQLFYDAETTFNNELFKATIYSLKK